MKAPRLDGLTWSVGLGTTLGLAGQSGSSFIFFALTNGAHLPVDLATEALTAEGVAMGLMMFALSPVINRLPLRPLLWAAILLTLGAQCFSAMVHNFVPMLAARTLSGLGFGIIYSIASASGAAAPVPERVYAAAGTIQLVFGTALNPVLGRGQALGQAGVFFGLSIFSALLAAGLLVAPPPRRLSVTGATTHSTVLASGRQRLAPGAVLLMMVIFAVGTNGVYIYYVPVAHGVGLSDARLGDGLAIVSLLGSLGGVAANRLGLRLGRSFPLATSLLALGGVSIWLLDVGTASQFWIAFTLWIMVYIFANSYLFGLAAAADPSGRLASATAAALTLANAGGTWAVGWVAARTGAASWGFVALTLCTLAATLGVGAARALRPTTESAEV